jgi:3-oxoacyl-[acyl-carrier-protein] synthase-3
MMRSVIIGCGGALPRETVTNQQLIARGVDTSDEWIVQRTGIRTRHLASAEETTSVLAVQAARTALQNAEVKAEDIDLVIVATLTPDNTFPATAMRVQEKLGIKAGFAFDVSAACSGFVYALTLADNFIRLGQIKTALIIGAETLSHILDWSDRSTCVLFGDGAGAVVVQAREGNGDNADQGILATRLHADGSYYDTLYADGGPGSTKTTGFLRMSGKEVFRQAVTCLSNVVDEVLETTGLKPEEVDWLVPHQANIRIIEGTAKKLKMPMAKVVVTVDQHANTSAASIPLALAHADAEGRFKRGDLILLDAMGAGLTWGAAVIRW